MHHVLALAAVGLFTLAAGTTPRTQPDPDAADVAALEQRNPEAARLLAEARSARESGQWERARDGFNAVLEREPEFHTAVRGLCMVEAELGHRSESLALCRRAVKAKRTATNLAALSIALSSRGKVKPTTAELQEAQNAAESAITLDPRDEYGWIARCEVAMHQYDIPALRRCSDRLVELVPNEPFAHAYTVIAALASERFGDARAALARGRASGMSKEQASELEKLIVDNEPFTHRVFRPTLYVVGGWTLALLVLFAAGGILSSVALRAAQRPVQGALGRAVGLSKSLRRVYAGVLWAACGFYCLSMPLLIVAVVAIGGGLIYGALMVGHVPVKLLVLVAVVVVVTVVAVLKSLFVRVRDEDPGLRLALGEHPRLDAALTEVAEKVGTRKVDDVFLTPGTELAVFERGKLADQLRGTSRRCLILGAAALDGMGMSPFKAVLAHEYGHLNNQDTAGGGFALAVRRSLLKMAHSLAQGGAAAWYNPVWLFLNGFYRIFLRISQGASRLQEVLADRWAAFSYGAAAFESGLKHVIERSIRFDAHANATIREVIEGERALANIYRYIPEKPVEADALDTEFKAALSRQPSPYDSHPAPMTRFALVKALPIADAFDGESGEAWDLLENRELLERKMTDEIRERIAITHQIAIRSDTGNPPVPQASADRTGTG